MPSKHSFLAINAGRGVGINFSGLFRKSSQGLSGVQIDDICYSDCETISLESHSKLAIRASFLAEGRRL